MRSAFACAARVPKPSTLCARRFAIACFGNRSAHARSSTTSPNAQLNAAIEDRRSETRNAAIEDRRSARVPHRTRTCARSSSRSRVLTHSECSHCDRNYLTRIFARTRRTASPFRLSVCHAMKFVGCSLRLFPVGGRMKRRMVSVHDVVEHGEKRRGGGGLGSCPQVWRFTMHPDRSDGPTICSRGGRAWRHSGRRRCHCCGNMWEKETSRPGSNRSVVSTAKGKSGSKFRVASISLGSRDTSCQRFAIPFRSCPAHPVSCA